MTRRINRFQPINSNNDIRPLVIVAKDDPLSLRLTCDVLEGRGYQTMAVTNGKMIAEAAFHHRPDLVLIDLNSHKISATEIVEKMYQNTNLQKTPVIVVRNSSMEDEASKAIYIEKSLSTRQLLEVIESELTKARKQEG